MRRILPAILMYFLAGIAGISAQVESDGQLVETYITEDDTLPYVQLDDVNIIDSPYFKSEKERRKWNKLMRNVIKVYPYARITKDLLDYYEEELLKIENPALRKKYMEEAEEVIKSEFKGEITKMTISQGRVLIKLIDRETGHTSYELIKDLRSGFTAFMWNSIAILFGNNLKTKYDPLEDYEIETIVRLIENGDIVVAERDASTAKARADLKKKRRRDKRRKRRAGRA